MTKNSKANRLRALAERVVEGAPHGASMQNTLHLIAAPANGKKKIPHLPVLLILPLLTRVAVTESYS